MPALAVDDLRERVAATVTDVREDGPVTIAIASSPREIEETWRGLETGEACLFQRYDWVAGWAREIGARRGVRPALVVGRRAGRPAFLWPFGVDAEGPVRVARWLGDGHSNYNVGLYAPGEAAALSDREVRSVLTRVAAAEGIDVFALERQPARWNGVVNPVVRALVSEPSASNGHACTLDPSFAAVLATRNGAHKRKRFRQREKAFDAIGDYRVAVAVGEDEAAFVLDSFFEQKARRFAEQGIRDCFAEPGVRDFYHRLIRSAPEGDALVRLHALSAAGRLRAIAGSATSGGRRYVLFLSFADDELARYSPGETLVYRMVEEACAEGVASLDFGVGEERFKQSWCDETVELYESTHPVTLRGRLFAAATRLHDRAKRAVKQTPWAWESFKRLRRLRGGAEPDLPPVTPP